MLPVLLAALLSASSASRTDPATQASADPAEVLRAADRAFFQATRERGLEGWLSFFADDAAVYPPEGPLVVGARDVRASYASQAGFPAKGFVWEPLEAGISTAGDLGWTLGHAGNDAGGTPVWSEGRYLSVWRRAADGSWRVVTDLGGDPGFARRLGGLDGAPATLGRESEHVFRSAQGELTAVLGSWWATDAAGVEVGGRYLSVWRRHADGTHELVIENGFARSAR